MNKKIQFLCFLCVAIICISSASSNALAQRKTFTGQESGVLTFYKLSGLTPNFESWILASEKYASLWPENKKQYFDEEMLRYQWLIGTLNPSHNFLTIHTEVDAKVLRDGEKSAIAIDFPGRVSSAGLYFPYNIHDIWVAVILENIKQYMLMPISSIEYNRIRGYLPASEDEHKLQLRITYRGISAQTKPMKIDNLEQYIMLGEIAHWSLELPDFHQSQDKTLWEYVAPWYRTEHEHALIQMLEGR
ncbi:MAG: hypothetical protein EA357_00005 [Micavibrio sp.]|nr:MAG: hypothetical protein EA357_00005 [Micavibrio sp.]